MVDIVRDKVLTKNLIILDGLTGTGKTMFSPLVASLNGVQNPRFEYMFEYLTIASKLNKINLESSAALLNLLSDVKYYDGMISRDVNFRPSDLSGVFQNGNGLKYISQLFSKDGISVENKIVNFSPMLFLVTHQILGGSQILFNAFNERLKIIEMVRHPLHLVDHWVSYIQMHGTSPRDFTIWIKYQNKSLPWFAEGWEEKYLVSSNYDKAIFSICRLMEEVYRSKKEGEEEKSDKILFIPFEKFVLSPDSYLHKLEIFLGLNMNRKTMKHLKAQNVPRKYIYGGVQKEIYKRYAAKFDSKQSHENHHNEILSKVKQQASTSAFNELMKSAESYDNYFGKWF
jgi:hypothetical protein